MSRRFSYFSFRTDKTFDIVCGHFRDGGTLSDSFNCFEQVVHSRNIYYICHLYVSLERCIFTLELVY